MLDYPKGKSVKEVKLEEARSRALVRASKRCVVIKKINHVLDGKKFLDVNEALDVISIELGQMPEAAATIKVINKLLNI